MTKGKLVLIPFPFDDLSGAKVRPAVCLTNPVGPHRHVVLAFMTSRRPTDFLETDIELSPTDVPGLRVPSVLRLHRLITVSTALIKRELGQLPANIQATVDGKLQTLFGLT